MTGPIEAGSDHQEIGVTEVEVLADMGEHGVAAAHRAIVVVDEQAVLGVVEDAEVAAEFRIAAPEQVGGELALRSDVGEDGVVEDFEKNAGWANSDLVASSGRKMTSSRGSKSRMTRTSCAFGAGAFGELNRSPSASGRQFAAHRAEGAEQRRMAGRSTAPAIAGRRPITGRPRRPLIGEPAGSDHQEVGVVEVGGGGRPWRTGSGHRPCRRCDRRRAFPCPLCR